ncbi:Secretion-regulating guanine nucleotide exchange factor [Smittium culicis]|uniref:Secretion-regulating guanine nucleotide exchange factor n=1 Tax=Smittium culicis TaxID=133412 RepID=A0A1R1X3L4_9FUNG|nr:Secretion-regulating guanine nucleotide exchange factor [Smittium culicis]
MCEAVATRWRVESFGSNSGGQLGVASNEDKYSPTPNQFMQHDANNSKPPVIVGGGNHSLLYWEDLPFVFGCGTFDDGELPLPDRLERLSKSVSVWRRLTIPVEEGDNSLNMDELNGSGKCSSCKKLTFRVKQITAGWNHTLLLSSTGKVYCCGSNSYGQCGFIKSLYPKIDVFTRVSIKENFEELKVVKLSSGLRHNLALTSKGFIYGWGSNSRSQLTGGGTSASASASASASVSATLKKPNRTLLDKIVFEPRRINLADNVIDISCGRYHSSWLSSESSIDSPSEAGTGELFSTKSEKQIDLVLCVVGRSDVTDYISKSVLGNVSGLKFASIKLGILLGQVNCNFESIKLKSSWDNLFVATNTLNTEEVGSANKPSRVYNVYGIGSNKFRVLGESPSAAEANDQAEHSPANKLDKNAELAVEPVVSLNVCSSLGISSSLVCGSYHAIALGGDGHAVCWGWNEHGNCSCSPCESVWPPNLIAIPEDPGYDDTSLRPNPQSIALPQPPSRCKRSTERPLAPYHQSRDLELAAALAIYGQ